MDGEGLLEVTLKCPFSLSPRKEGTTPETVPRPGLNPVLLKSIHGSPDPPGPLDGAVFGDRSFKRG